MFISMWNCISLFKWEHLTVCVSKCEQLSLFVCPSHIGCSRCPVWISFNVNLLSLSIRIQLNVRATRAALPCLFLCALPEWTSTGYGNIGSLIWIIRLRRLRYLCSRCIQMSDSDITRHIISQQTAVCTSIRRACQHSHTAAYVPYRFDLYTL